MPSKAKNDSNCQTSNLFDFFPSPTKSSTASPTKAAPITPTSEEDSPPTAPPSPSVPSRWQPSAPLKKEDSSFTISDPEPIGNAPDVLPSLGSLELVPKRPTPKRQLQAEDSSFIIISDPAPVNSNPSGIPTPPSTNPQSSTSQKRPLEKEDSIVLLDGPPPSATVSSSTSQPATPSEPTPTPQISPSQGSAVPQSERKRPKPLRRDPTVIVIDDDDEDLAISRRPTKRARLSEDDSSDIEVVDVKHTNGVKHSLPKDTPSWFGSGDTMGLPKPSSHAAAQLFNKSFGEPSDLLLVRPDSPPPTASSSSQPPPSPSSPPPPPPPSSPPQTSSRPSSRIEQAKSAIVNISQQNTPTPSQGKRVLAPFPMSVDVAAHVLPEDHTLPQLIDLTAVTAEEEDVWETGDDEVSAESYDDRDPDEVSDTSNEDGAKSSPCPVCDNWFPFKVIDAHVTSCINSLTEDEPSTTKQPILVASPSKKGEFTTNAFSVLMSSDKRAEEAAWQEAAAAEDRSFRPTKANGGRRLAPFYKVLTGMPIAVDAFKYGAIPGVTAYFLTHAHSDHYTNLSATWKHGPIYCSEGTANLIVHMLNVDRKWVHPLPMDQATIIPNTGGVAVTPIEANHCPGSSIFLFEGPQTINAGDCTQKISTVGSKRIFRYLHCGDFRACPNHVLHPAIKDRRIDTVYLDTTFMDPKHCFPPQPLVIAACVELVKRLAEDGTVVSPTNNASQRTMDGFFVAQVKQTGDTKPKERKVLVVMGTYSIGKERIVKAVAKALNSKIFCEPRKQAILRCQGDPELNALLTSNPLVAAVHVVTLNTVSGDHFKDYIARFSGHFTHAVGFRPTGWTFTPASGTDTLPSVASVISREQRKTYSHANLQPSRGSSAAIQTYGVPYSEHSSFFELTCFALSLDWDKMIPTVNVSEKSRAKMSKWFEKWRTERKKKKKDYIVPYRDLEYW